MLRAYFLATACIFEPDRGAERLGWAKTMVLAAAVALYFGSEPCTEEAQRSFVNELQNGDMRFVHNYK